MDVHIVGGEASSMPRELPGPFIPHLPDGNLTRGICVVVKCLEVSLGILAAGPFSEAFP